MADIEPGVAEYALNFQLKNCFVRKNFPAGGGFFDIDPAFDLCRVKLFADLYAALLEKETQIRGFDDRLGQVNGSAGKFKAGVTGAQGINPATGKFIRFSDSGSDSGEQKPAVCPVLTVACFFCPDIADQQA